MGRPVTMPPPIIRSCFRTVILPIPSSPMRNSRINSSATGTIINISAEVETMESMVRLFLMAAYTANISASAMVT